MPIRHIVLLPFKPSLSKAEIEQIMLSLAKLKDDIPQILSFSWGANNSPENLHRGYLHGFVMEFKDDIHRKIYLEHPLHIRIAQEIVLPALVDGVNSPLVFDYTF
jgi:hypothetical protein